MVVIVGKLRLKENLFAAELAIFLAISAQLTIPLPLVPLTGQTLAVGVLASITSYRLANKSLIVYVLLGLIGLPVYASASAGVGVLFGPLGGFIWGFFIQAWLIIACRRRPTFGYLVFGNLVGGLAQLIIGSLWLMAFNHLSLMAAAASGLIPFLIPGAIKAVLAAMVANILLAKVKLPFHVNER